MLSYQVAQASGAARGNKEYEEGEEGRADKLRAEPPARPCVGRQDPLGVGGKTDTATGGPRGRNSPFRKCLACWYLGPQPFQRSPQGSGLQDLIPGNT